MSCGICSAPWHILVSNKVMQQDDRSGNMQDAGGIWRGAVYLER